MNKHNTTTTTPDTESTEWGSAVVFVTDINRLPLLQFMDALVDGDYSGIIVSGIPTAEEVEAAWEAIKGQYVELSATEEQKMAMVSECDRVASRIGLDALNELLKAAMTSLNPELLDLLENEGYGINLDTDPSGIEQQLRVIGARLKGELLRLNMDNPEEGEQKESKPITRDFFYDIIAMYVRENKVHLNANSLYGGEFCRYYKQLCQDLDRKSRLHRQKAQTADHD